MKPEDINKYNEKQKRRENAKKLAQNPWLIFISKPMIIIYVLELLFCLIISIRIPEDKILWFFKMLFSLAGLTFFFVFTFFVYEDKKTPPIQQPPRIQCPYCKSYNTSKISTLNRGVSTAAFGLASSKLGKQWHCKNCNSDF